MAFKFSSMKKVLTTFLSILLAIFLSSEIAIAQGGNLQFNQVININPGMSYTVPAGKVFKVESVSAIQVVMTNQLVNAPYYAPCYQCDYGSELVYLSIDNLNFKGPSGTVSSCYTPCPSGRTVEINLPAINLPIWLKASKTISVNSIVSNLLVTGIEFNITN